MAQNQQDTRVWDQIVRKMRKMSDGTHVRVGVFGNAAKAAAHEYGAPSINLPERSFLRLTFRKGADELEKMTTKIFNRFLEGQLSPKQALELLGEWGIQAVRKTIRDQPEEWPPLSPVTIARKGYKKDKILIDTGELINSIAYKIAK